MLYYHKCNDCLTAFSSTERKIDYCDCNGDVSYMGQVHGDQYIKTEDRPPCDGRCTHASGPHCDCQCGGANHGTGKLVQTVVAQGKVKAVGLTEQDIERADMYRKLRDYADNIYTQRWCQESSGSGSNQQITSFRQQYGDDYRLRIQAKRELDKIKKMKVYDARTKALVEFITKYKV